MHGVGATDGLWRCFAQSQVAHFSSRNEFSHCTYRLFYRYGRINAVLIIQIDDVHFQSFEARFTSRSHVLGFAVDAERCSIGVALIAKLGTVKALLSGLNAQAKAAATSLARGSGALHDGFETQ